VSAFDVLDGRPIVVGAGGVPFVGRLFACSGQAVMRLGMTERQGAGAVLRRLLRGPAATAVREFRAFARSARFREDALRADRYGHPPPSASVSAAADISCSRFAECGAGAAAGWKCGRIAECGERHAGVAFGGERVQPARRAARSASNRKTRASGPSARSTARAF